MKINGICQEKDLKTLIKQINSIFGINSKELKVLENKIKLYGKDK
jgi:hypothetical protein